MNLIMKLLTWILVTVFLSSVAHAQEEMRGSIGVNNPAVSSSTQLTFNLLLSQVINSGDYLEINLPSTQDVSFEVGRGFCTIQLPLQVTACQIITPYRAVITLFQSSQSTQISGSIGWFKNPPSTITVTDFMFKLFQENGVLKATYSSGTLNGLAPTSMTMTLSSSSPVVGQNGVTLTATVQSQPSIPAQGFFLLQFPSYYTSAGYQDQYISSTNPYCSVQGASVSACSFNMITLQLSLEFKFSNELPQTQPVTIRIGQFKNPINPEPKTGFSIIILDQKRGQVSAVSSVTLSGITQPTNYRYLTHQFIDTNLLGAYSIFQLNVGMQIPLDPQCFIKIIFPDEFSIDQNLFQITGTSFFQQPNGMPISLSQVNYSQRSIIFPACQVTYGANLIGSITFSRVGNPKYLKDTGQFQVQIAKDYQFTQLITEVQNFFIKALDLEPGKILGINVAVQNPEVQASTGVAFQFTPSSSLSNSQYRVMIQFPITFKLGNICQLSAVVGLTGSYSCSFDITNNIAYINNPFSSFSGGQAIAFLLQYVTNPTGVMQFGTFKIQTQALVDGIFYGIDGSNFISTGSTSPGTVSGREYAYSSNQETYSSQGTFIFKVATQHNTPVGGKIKVNLPNNMEIKNPNLLASNCYRLNKSPQPILLQCQATQTSFEISITQNNFGPNGLQSGENFDLQVTSLRNPRSVGQSALFQFQTYDSSNNLIDQSFGDQKLVLIATQPGYMTSVVAQPQNSTTGATSQYALLFTPNTPVFSGDQITLTLPSQIKLVSSNVQCSGNPDFIPQVICFTQDQETITIQLARVNSIQQGQGFVIYISGIKNPTSTRPTESFTNILLKDASNQIVSQYKTLDVFVIMNNEAVFQTYSLTQSTKAPSEQAIYTITFQTDSNPLPPASSIQITTPNSVRIEKDWNQCYVKIFDGLRKNVCQFEDMFTIRINNVFADQLSNYQGQVQVIFSAVNPASNDVQAGSLSMMVYDDNSYKFKVGAIPSGMSPSFQCNSPCQTCQLQNPSYCLSCPTGNYKPGFLQKNLIQQTSTCVNQCNTGFSPNLLTRTCVQCDPTCLACKSGGTPADAITCVQCGPKYPVFWKERSQCFSITQGCPVGSFPQTPTQCTTCTPPCTDCASKNTCKRCDPKSSTPYLSNSRCVSFCPVGQTVMRSTNGTQYCQQCKYPCKDCQAGFPDSCLSCADIKNQFVFGSQCVNTCPQGTSKNMLTFKCEGCLQGCDLCDNKNQSVCLRCSEGLSLLNDTCVSPCPEGYLKSLDGRTCELRQYPLSKLFIPFPFLIVLAILWGVNVVLYLIQKSKTQLVQVLMVSTSFIVFAATLHELTEAIAQKQQLPIIVSAVIIAFNIIVSSVFTITLSLQEPDFQFNEYKSKQRNFYNFIIGISSVISMHIIRIIFSKVLRHPKFYATATIPDNLFKPIHLFSLIYMAAVIVPNIIANGFFVYATWQGRFWDNQLFMTMFEQCFINFGMLVLIIYDRIFIKPKFMVFKPNDDNPFHVKLGEQTRLTQVMSKFDDSAYNPVIQQQKIKIGKQSISSEESEYYPAAEKGIRYDNLMNIIREVRRNKDLKLNAGLDQVMDSEIVLRPKKQDSMPDLFHNEVCSDSDPLNMSYPGLNYDLKDDGTGKRLQLLDWMQKQVEIAAAQDRIEREQLILQLRQQDKICQYDNQLYDNVYFSPRTRRPLVGVQVQTNEQPAPVPKLMLNQNMQTSIKTFKDQSMQFQESNSISKIDKLDKFTSVQAPQNKDQSIQMSDLQSSLGQLIKKKTTKNQNAFEGDMSSVQKSNKSKKDEVDYFDSGHEYEEQIQESLKLQDSRESFVRSELLRNNSSQMLSIGTETKKWVDRVQLLKTLLLDGTSARKTPKTPGGTLRKEKKQSQTQKTLEQKNYDNLVEQFINEETIELENEIFYKRGMDSGRGLSDASSVNTSDLDEPRLKERQDLETFLREKVSVNCRNFNVNDVMGNFSVDSHGDIVNRKETIWQNNFRDKDGQLVNEKGYLINEKTGAIRSKYTFEDLFLPITGCEQDQGEIPMPYRLERWNFNPHKILGNFDYDPKSRKPIFLQNRYKQFTDKNFRLVNQCGFLINERDDVIDDDGHVIFQQPMLNAQGNIPVLLNYQGEQFKIQDIIGQVKKDNISKEILVRVDQKTGKAVDERGRNVNANGYLIDERGNIVNLTGDVVFRFWELTFQEPPKIFSFTKFNIDWIKGRINKNSLSAKNDNLYDLDGRLINNRGYFIDEDENIIDQYRRFVFRKELLTNYKGQDSEIPQVFLSGQISALQHSSVAATIVNYDKKQQSVISKSELKTDVGKSEVTKSDIKKQASMLSIGDGSSMKEEEIIQNIKIKTESQKRQRKHIKKKQMVRSRTQRPGQKVISLYQQYIENGNVNQVAIDKGVFTETVSGKQVITPLVLPPRTPIVRPQGRNDYTPNMTSALPARLSEQRIKRVLSPTVRVEQGFMSDALSAESANNQPKRNGFFGDSQYSGHNDRHLQLQSMQSFQSKAEIIFQNQNLKRQGSPVEQDLNHIDKQFKNVNLLYGNKPAVWARGTKKNYAMHKYH